MDKKHLLCIILLGSLLISCQQKKAQPDNAKPDSTAQVTYAKGFSIEYFAAYKRVTVYNPWKKNAIYARYYLVKDKSTTVPADGQKIKIPIQTIAATCGTQFEFLNLIGNLNSITGICTPKLIYNKVLLGKIQQHKLTDLGDPFSLNIEKVQLLHPDAVMVSGFNQEDPVSKRLMEYGTPVIFDNEWTENTLLARAEWIKFIASFYNKEQLADGIFNHIANNYIAIREKAKHVTKRPTVMCGGNFKGTWYMPGGKSYMAGLLSDAGADYHYANDTTKGSLPLNFEVALNNFRHTDVWIGSSANSIAELLNIDERHGLFDAAKNKQVFNFNARVTPTGGNDFWESGTAHPDLILADMIKIFHPDLMNGHAFVYVRKLE
ncbi:MAG: ABC transporter substrate-binding protein [Paludibacteraceae bacterium]|nr:ABC transporter substrate-binding protein [Paludibacteraceae bacterium]